MFLTASEAIRARRRSADLAADPQATAELTQREQARRDRRDAPQMARAADAVEIDTTRAGPGRGHRRDRRPGPQPPGGAPWLSPASRIGQPGLDHWLDQSSLDQPAGTSRPGRPVLAVVGRPNVGKSTLVNRILGSRQAVVEDTPGVTRDRVTYDATWRGRAFTLVDTGGWEPEAEGGRSMAARVAAQARVAVEAADAVLFVVDAVVGRDRRRRGRGRGAAPVPQAGRAGREQGRRRAGRGRRQLAVVARAGRAVLGQRAARPGQRRPAGRDARRAARGAGGDVRRRRAARAGWR